MAIVRNFHSNEKKIVEEIQDVKIKWCTASVIYFSASWDPGPRPLCSREEMQALLLLLLPSLLLIIKKIATEMKVKRHRRADLYKTFVI